MHRAFIIAAAVVLAVTGRIHPAAAQAPQPVATAIVDLDYVDTSGETGDQTQAHKHLVQIFTQRLAQDLTASGRFRIVPLNCGTKPCASTDDPQELQKAARAAGVKLVVLGGFHKMSTLVQWAKIQIFDAAKGSVVFDRLVTFRNDTEEAWTRAETFLLREIMATQIANAAPAAAQPIKLAAFDFELEDFSGGAGIIPESAEDRAALQQATDETRKILVQSGRYSLVDMSTVDAPQARAHELRKCDGCDAVIARKLGADQALLGIVTRITRTDYAVTFKLRDAQTGKPIAVEQSDLRIGANYSWPRGAVALIQRRLLDNPPPR